MAKYGSVKLNNMLPSLVEILLGIPKGFNPIQPHKISMIDSPRQKLSQGPRIGSFLWNFLGRFLLGPSSYTSLNTGLVYNTQVFFKGSK